MNRKLLFTALAVFGLASMAANLPENATALREDYRKVAKTLGSDHEYRKAIDALD